MKPRQPVVWGEEAQAIRTGVFRKPVQEHRGLLGARFFGDVSDPEVVEFTWDRGVFRRPEMTEYVVRRQRPRIASLEEDSEQFVVLVFELAVGHVPEQAVERRRAQGTFAVVGDEDIERGAADALAPGRVAYDVLG